MTTDSSNNIELRSDEVQEILGALPRWIIRWGITVVLIILIVLITGSYFYKYPDLIRARITIISENPPVHIVARATGKIDTFFIQDNQMVKKGQLLGIIENPSDFINVFELKRIIDDGGYFFTSPDTLAFKDLTKEFNLGTIQTYYTTFLAQWQEYLTFLRSNYFDQRIISLKKQLVEYRAYYEKKQREVTILEEDLKISRRQMNRDSSLWKNGVWADSDYEKAQATYNKQKLSYQSSVSDLANLLIEISKIDQGIQEQEIQKTERGNNLLASLREKYDNLNSQLVAWEQDFVLAAPIEGKITFNTIWATNQYVSTGSIVFTIVPEGNQNIIGRALLPVTGAGKVEPGQRVNIKLENFPYVEYGIVEGKVMKISKVPVKAGEMSYYTAEVSLPFGLVTNYRKELPSNQEMQGIAEFITKDRRLLERLIQPLVALFRERITP